MCCCLKQASWPARLRPQPTPPALSFPSQEACQEPSQAQEQEQDTTTGESLLAAVRLHRVEEGAGLHFGCNWRTAAFSNMTRLINLPPVATAGRWKACKLPTSPLWPGQEPQQQPQ